jgi:hypothetical protein
MKVGFDRLANMLASGKGPLHQISRHNDYAFAAPQQERTTSQI